MIKLDTIEPGTKFVTTATVEKKNGEEVFTHIGVSRKHSSIWGVDPDKIVDIECEIVDNDLLIDDLMLDKDYDNNCVDYFCHAEIEKDGRFDIGLIYANIKVYFVCFPYGADASRFWHHTIERVDGTVEHKEGDRRAYNMRIKVRKL